MIKSVFFLQLASTGLTGANRAIITRDADDDRSDDEDEDESTANGKRD